MGLHVTKEIDMSLLEVLPKNLNSMKILDLGCGFGWLGWLLRCCTDFVGNFRLFGVDIDSRTINNLRQYNLYNQLTCVDVVDFFEYVAGNYFNVSVCVELLEHLNKTDGLFVLNELIRCTSGMVIVSVPLGFQKTVGVFDNKYNIHLSSWFPKDFDGLGFEVKILESLSCGRVIKFLDGLRRKFLGVPKLNEHIFCVLRK